MMVSALTGKCVLPTAAVTGEVHVSKTAPQLVSTWYLD